jgi:hypothetical protein
VGGVHGVEVEARLAGFVPGFLEEGPGLVGLLRGVEHAPPLQEIPDLDQGGDGRQGLGLVQGLVGLVEADLEALGAGDLGQELAEEDFVPLLPRRGEQGGEGLLRGGGVLVVPEFVEVGELIGVGAPIRKRDRRKARRRRRMRREYTIGSPGIETPTRDYFGAASRITFPRA